LKSHKPAVEKGLSPAPGEADLSPPSPDAADAPQGENARRGKHGNTIWLVLGTSFGLGYTPLIPGTAGALPGVGIYVLVALMTTGLIQTTLILAALVATGLLTVALGPWAERYWKVKDPKIFVLDEVVGFLGTVLLFRTPDLIRTVLWVFFVTRVIDIIKVPPARQLEKLPAGIGIVADDLCSSVYAALILHLGAKCFPHWFGL